MLGVGIGGEYAQEFRAVQVPIEERGRRTNEMIPLLRRLWTAEPITHDGRYYPMERREDPPGTGAAGRSADHRRRPQGARDAPGRDARRRLVPVPVLTAPLRRFGGDHPSDRGGGRPRPRGLPLVRVGVPQRQPRRRRGSRGGGPHDGRHLQPGLQADDRQRRGGGHHRRGRPPSSRRSTTPAPATSCSSPPPPAATRSRCSIGCSPRSRRHSTNTRGEDLLARDPGLDAVIAAWMAVVASNMRAAYRGSASARSGPENPTTVRTRMTSPSGAKTGAVSAVTAYSASSSPRSNA